MTDTALFQTRSVGTGVDAERSVVTAGSVTRRVVGDWDVPADGVGFDCCEPSTGRTGNGETR